MYKRRKNKYLISILISIITIGMLGIISTQLFWVKNAYTLKEEQFNRSARLALREAVMKIEDQIADSTKIENKEHWKEHMFFHGDILGQINSTILDSLIASEFKNMHLPINYDYAVFNYKTHHIVSGKYKKENLDKVLETKHFMSLACLQRKDANVIGVYFPGERNYLISQMQWWLVLSALFVFMVLVSFTYTIMSWLKQKKISEIKNDFVNNMTHELKTPIATISVSSEMLCKANIISDNTKIEKYARIIKHENNRLKGLVEKVLHIATLEKDVFEKSTQQIDAHKLLLECIENIDMQIKEKNGKISFNLNAENYKFYFDPLHFTNIISNLLDNAEKYSFNTPDITIETINESNYLIVRIEDKGIGISSQHQKHIFNQFYRIPTGNIHNVKGFGLGLYYVKTIMNVYGGKITVQSEPKVGTKFSLYFLINNN